MMTLQDILCDYFDSKLIFNEEAYKNVESIFARLNRTVTERNRLQAMIPDVAIPLKNNRGTAPGIYIERNGKHFFSLPGVPAEMKGLTEDHILDIIQTIITKDKHDVCKYKVLNFAGIPESSLADLLQIDETVLSGRTLAFLPNYKGIRLRIGANAENMEIADNKIAELESYILERASEYFIGFNDENISSAIGKKLIERNHTLSVAESCTGGLLGGFITDMAGSSAYFEGGIISYSNSIKINSLGVSEDTINLYGAVSEETAIEMASKARTKFNTDFGLSITGIAGPTGGTDEKPVGTVWIGLSTSDSTLAYKYNFGNNREYNRERAVSMALVLLHNYLCK
jgi:nicotinamide-nucleotide amidase